MMYLHHIYVFAVPIKGCRACRLSLLQSLSCLALCGAAQTHTEKAFSPANIRSGQSLMPQGNKWAGFTPGLSPHWLSGSTAEDKFKPLAKSKQFVITVSFTQAGTNSKESPFLICLFYFVHFLSKPFLALVVQIHTVGPKHSSAFASALYQHCHGYIIIPTSAS